MNKATIIISWNELSRYNSEMKRLCCELTCEQSTPVIEDLFGFKIIKEITISKLEIVIYDQGKFSCFMLDYPDCILSLKMYD